MKQLNLISAFDPNNIKRSVVEFKPKSVNENNEKQINENSANSLTQSRAKKLVNLAGNLGNGSAFSKSIYPY